MWIVISGILGILGFIISVINIAHYFWRNRVNIEITIFSHEMVSHDMTAGTLTAFRFCITNKSQLPISITDMKLCIKDEIFPAEHETFSVKQYNITDKSGKIIDKISAFNRTIPLDLPALGSTAGYFVYLLPLGTDLTFQNNLTFEIATNRSQVMKMKLESKVPTQITHRSFQSSCCQNHHNSEGNSN